MDGIVLVGPTAVGKSAVAEEIALTLKTDILVADSRQVYQGMDIGTNKPTLADQKRVPRHLINLILPDAPFSVGAYLREAEPVISRLEKEGKPILIEGGTGLYIKALLYGLWKGPPRNPELRKMFMTMEQNEGEGTLYRKLADLDPLSAMKVSVRDLPKIIRALEVFHITGRPISQCHAEHRFGEHRSFRIIGLCRERADLYRRIEARVDRQLAMGLIEETRRLLDTVSPQCPSMQALGYRQVVPYLQGERTEDEMVRILKQDTRHYAKRQMTWFRANPQIGWIDIKGEGSPKEIAAQVMDKITNKTDGYT